MCWRIGNFPRRNRRTKCLSLETRILYTYAEVAPPTLGIYQYGLHVCQRFIPDGVGFG